MSELIGLDLHQDLLFLTRGRDFKWTFQNLDETTKQPTNFPSGDLFFELDTGGQQNAVQQISQTAASGGTYTLGVGGQTTGALAYDMVVQSSHDATPDITSALEGLSTVGVGNVSLTPAQLFPVWEIDLTLNAGNNELQQLVFTGVTGGTFKLGYGGLFTPVLAWNAAPSAVQTALEALTGIGTGNVAVTPITNGYQFEFIGAKADTNVDQLLVVALGIDLSQPFFIFGLTGDLNLTAKVSTVLDGSPKFTDSMVNTLNTTVNNMFNSFDSLLGVNIDYEVLSDLNTKLTVTSLKAFAESELLTFSIDVTGQLVEGFLNSVAQFLGIFDTIDVDFYWNRVFQVEFVGDLAELPQPKIVADITHLTGLNDEQAISVDVLQKGVSRWTNWPFTVDGSSASIVIEAPACDVIQARTSWQLVFKPEGEDATAGGDPLALGIVRTQGDDR